MNAIFKCCSGLSRKTNDDNSHAPMLMGWHKVRDGFVSDVDGFVILFQVYYSTDPS